MYLIYVVYDCLVCFVIGCLCLFLVLLSFDGCGFGFVWLSCLLGWIDLFLFRCCLVVLLIMLVLVRAVVCSWFDCCFSLFCCFNSVVLVVVVL